MAIKYKHSDAYSLYFCTFTCFQWLPLFEITNSYNIVYKWFDILQLQHFETVAYVIMPNHVHTIHYFPEPGFSLNTIISNAKRFIGYEMIQRLQLNNEDYVLTQLSHAVTTRERIKGQKHKVFEQSFDAKGIYSQAFFYQKLDYVHHNPVNGKWKLADDFTKYEHSSASYYETGVAKHFIPFDYRNL